MAALSGAAIPVHEIGVKAYSHGTPLPRRTVDNVGQILDEGKPDLVIHTGGKFYMLGRFSSCDTACTHIGQSGARVFEFTAGQSGFRTWVRLYGEGVKDSLNLRRDMKYLHK